LTDGLPDDCYYDKVDYQYEYQNKKGPWFKWLYVDIDTLFEESARHGYRLQVLSEDYYGQYLARLARLNNGA
jgi:hypothetical protein